MTLPDFSGHAQSTCGQAKGRSQLAALAMVGLGTPAWAQQPAETPVKAAPVTAARANWEGAVGLVMRYGPSYAGASDFSVHLTPAGFLRWGRFTLTGAGGFTTISKGEVERGLGVELLDTERLDLRLGLRLDRGRSESESKGLSGLGDVRQTVRARLSARWQLDKHWQLGSSISLDIGGRKGGYLADVSLAREWIPMPSSRVIVSASLAAADQIYMQAWHGITPEQSSRSGLPAYTASAGLRNVSASVQWRQELSPRWSGFVGVSSSKLLGPAADSPLTSRNSAEQINAGLAWRF